MSDASPTYNLAVVFDDIRRDFDAVVDELTRLHQRLAPQPLLRIDLAFLPPTTLVCGLYLDAMAMGITKLADRLSVAQTRHFRVLDLMSIAATDGSEIYARQVEQAQWKKLPSQDLTADLNELRGFVGSRQDGSERRSAGRAELSLPVRFSGGPEMAVGLAKNISAAGMYIESDVIPHNGTPLTLALHTLGYKGLRRLPARVVYTLSHQQARRHGRIPGFGVVLELDDQQHELFESFLLAALRGQPWPEQSGRRHERFALAMWVEYEVGGKPQRSVSANVGRGGMFLRTDTPPVHGSELRLRLVSPRGENRVELRGRVVHVVTAAEAATRPAGAGISFIDPPEAVEAALRQLVGNVEPTVLRRALIVDDDSFFRSVMSNILLTAGFEPVEASSGEAAYRELLQGLLHFDVVLLDYYMPGLSPLGLIEWVRRTNATTDVAVAVVSAAQLSEHDRNRLIAAGVDDVIPKETEAPEILARIEAACRKRSTSTSHTAPAAPK